MIQKLTKDQFTDLLERREDLKRARKAAKEYQEEDDIRQVQQMRTNRLYKKANLIV